jgi:hypothetical protein
MIARDNVSLPLARTVRVARATAVALAAHTLLDRAKSASGATGGILHVLTSLYGTDKVLEHAAWHTADGRLTADLAQALLNVRDE